MGETGDEMVGGSMDSMDMSLSKPQETVKDRVTCVLQSTGVAKSQTQLRD